MRSDIKKLYEEARENQDFLREIKEADNDEAPSFFASSTKKHLFVAVYYGWQVARGEFKSM